MFKLTKCANCKTKFKHDKNQTRKYCSQSCSTIVKNKLQAKPKKKKVMKQTRREWDGYWRMYHLGLVSLQDIKNLMKERYYSCRDLVTNYNAPVEPNFDDRTRLTGRDDKSIVC